MHHHHVSCSEYNTVSAKIQKRNSWTVYQFCRKRLSVATGKAQLLSAFRTSYCNSTISMTQHSTSPVDEIAKNTDLTMAVIIAGIL